MMTADFGRFSLPSGGKVFHEDYEVRIAHRHGDAAHFAESKLDGEFISDLGLAHGDLEVELHFGAAHERTGLDASPGSDGESLFCLVVSEVGSHAPGTVAGNFRLRSIGIEEAGANVGIVRREKPLHAVGPESVATITDATTERGEVSGSMDTLDDQEIVAAGVRLDKGNDHGFGIHS